MRNDASVLQDRIEREGIFLRRPVAAGAGDIGLARGLLAIGLERRRWIGFAAVLHLLLSRLLVLSARRLLILPLLLLVLRSKYEEGNGRRKNATETE